MRPHVRPVTTPAGATVLFVADGHCANTTAGEGNPIEIMDLSLALQLRALDHLAATSLPLGVHAAAGVDRRRGGGVAARRRRDPHRRADGGATARRDDVVSAVTIHAAGRRRPGRRAADRATAPWPSRASASSPSARATTSSPPIRTPTSSSGRACSRRGSSTPTPTCSTRRSRRSARRRSRATSTGPTASSRSTRRGAATTGGRRRSTGIAAGLRSGTTCFGDVVTDEPALDVLVAAGVAGVAYFEIIGVDADALGGRRRRRSDRDPDDARRAPRTPASGCHRTRPYSVAEPVLQASTALARRLGLRIHTHLAEIDSEDELYRAGTGVWADRIRPRHDRGWPQFDAGGVGPRRRRVRRGVRAARARQPRRPRRLPRSRRAPAARRCRARRSRCARAPTSPSASTRRPSPTSCARACRSASAPTRSGSNASLDLLADVALLRRLAVEGGYDRRRPRPTGCSRRRRSAGPPRWGWTAELGALAPGRRADLAVWDVDPAAPERALVAERRRTLHGHRRRRGTSARGLTLRHFPS